MPQSSWVADVQVRKTEIRVDNDVDDVITAPALAELSRSWCEHDTLGLGERALYNHLDSLSRCGA